MTAEEKRALVANKSTAPSQPGNVAAINAAYANTLGRAPDPSGLQSYGATGWNQAQIEADIKNSPEYKSKNSTANQSPFNMSSALKEAEGIYSPQVTSTNQYYDTLAQRLSDIETQQLGTLKSGWAGSETLPSSGFYQQQRSDLLKSSGEQRVGAEKSRAAELAAIAAQKSSYARGAYLQGLTAPLVEQQRASAQQSTGASASLNYSAALAQMLMLGEKPSRDQWDLFNTFYFK